MESPWKEYEPKKYDDAFLDEVDSAAY
jgi:hypothetical protein